MCYWKIQMSNSDRVTRRSQGLTSNTCSRMNIVLFSDTGMQEKVISRIILIILNRFGTVRATGTCMATRASMAPS